MTAEHNHPPRCCCPDPGPRTDYLPPTFCSGCPEHGTFARDGIVCPQCKTAIGQPHTDYCTFAPGRVWDGVLTADTDRPYFAEQAGRASRGVTHDAGPWCVPYNCTEHPRRVWDGALVEHVDMTEAEEVDLAGQLRAAIDRARNSRLNQPNRNPDHEHIVTRHRYSGGGAECTDPGCGRPPGEHLR